jgi:hypothetical protein
LLLEGKKLQDKLAKLANDDKNKQLGKFTNTKSEQYTAKKFAKEYDRIIQEMFTGLDET